MDQSQQQQMNGSADHHQPDQVLLPSDHHKQKRLESFWADQLKEAEQTTDFKNYTLPLARVKKIMKAEEDVKMIASEAPMILAKASEMFISELTLRAWMHTEENKRKTLQKNDIAAAVSKTDMFDFLVDIVPRNDDPVSYYYVPAAAGLQYAAGGPSGTAFYGDHAQHHQNDNPWAT